MGVPQIGGNYTHFSYLAEGLPEYDWKLLQVGKINQPLIEDSRFVQIKPNLDRKKDTKELAKSLLDYLTENEFDILIPMNSPIAVSIIPHSPTNIKIVNIVNNDKGRVYKAVTEHLTYISKIICISPKQIDALKKHKNKSVLIPHGTKIWGNIEKSNNEKFTIGFLGRLHHNQKGILLLPEILKDLSKNLIFEIVGDGQDKEDLLEKLETENVNYKFFGFISGREKEEIIRHWDLLLFPSFFEGFGLTLIECMKYGVVPIANKIEGITDYIIDDGINGFVVENNDPQVFREKITLLMGNEALRNKLSENAIQKVKTEFNIEKILDAYKNEIQKALEYKKPDTTSINKWKPYKEYKPSFLTRISNYITKK